MKALHIKAIFAGFLCCAAFAFSACDHDHATPADTSIAVTAPQEDAVVNPGQAVAITGSITGQKEIHGYKLSVRQINGNKVLFSKDVHEHEKEIAINETWTVDTVAKRKDLELEVIVTLDHDGNTLSKTVRFFAAP